MNRCLAISLVLVFISWKTGAVAQQLIPQAGQYGAGFEIFNADPGETTEIRTAVWYPTVADATGSSSVYPWGDWRFESPFLGVTDSDEVPNEQQFPLVVLSHGTDAWGGQFAYLGESLASHGYVVAAPYHSTSNLLSRPDELLHTVDTMLARSESAQDKLHGLVNADSVAVGGYSYGAATTSTALKRSNAIDVDAVLLIDGAGASWDFDGDAPVMHIGGGDIGFKQTLSRIGSPEFYAIDIGAGSDEVRAHHWSFGVNGCQIREQVLSAGLAAGATEEEILAAVRPDRFWLGCNPAYIPPTEVQERMNVQAVGFLDSVMKHDGGLGDLLSPGKNTTDADLWLTVSVDSNSASKGVAVLLTDPSGRSIGLDASTGEAIDDFEGSSLGNATRAQRSLSFGLPQESLVPGEYVLTAVGSALDTNQTYMVQLGSAFGRGEDVVFSQTLVASGTVEPNSEIEPFHFTLSAVPEPSGDFNGDGILTTFDIDLLMNEVAAGTDDITFDLNSDGAVDDGDRDEWLTQAAPERGFAESLLVGDSNLDGTVDSIDLNALALNWRGETEVNDWTRGNFTGAAVNSIDLNALALNWRQTASATIASQVVPEPGCLALVAVAGLVLAAYRRPTS